MGFDKNQIIASGGKELTHRNGSKYIVRDDMVIAKMCRACKIWKSIDSYNDSLRGIGGKRAGCRECRNNYMKAWREINEEHCDKYKEEHAERQRLTSLLWKERHKREVAEYDRIYQIENRERRRLNNARRNARKEMLPDEYTFKQHEETMEQFEMACALTGQRDDLHLDHIIPIAVGHGGTIFGNMAPIKDSLNTSKGDSNIFEWFEANRQRFELSQDKFDRLIGFLAEANEMTINEYRDYVYWCHDNKRIVDEIKADNKRYGYKKSSAEIWNDFKATYRKEETQCQR